MNAILLTALLLATGVNADCPTLEGIYLCDGGGDDMSGLKVSQGLDGEGPWIAFGEGAPQVRLNGRGHFEAEDGTQIAYQAVCRDATRIVLEIASTEISPATSLEITQTGPGYRVDANEAGEKSTETCVRHRGHGQEAPVGPGADT